MDNVVWYYVTWVVEIDSSVKLCMSRMDGLLEEQDLFTAHVGEDGVLIWVAEDTSNFDGFDDPIMVPFDKLMGGTKSRDEVLARMVTELPSVESAAAKHNYPLSSIDQLSYSELREKYLKLFDALRRHSLVCSKRIEF